MSAVVSGSVRIEAVSSGAPCHFVAARVEHLATNTLGTAITGWRFDYCERRQEYAVSWQEQLERGERTQPRRFRYCAVHADL